MIFELATKRVLTEFIAFARGENSATMEVRVAMKTMPPFRAGKGGRAF
jgi:hypothetical protein